MVALIAVITTVLYPRLSDSVRARGISEAQDGLSEFVHAVRVEAVRQRLKTRLRISKDHTEFWADIQDRTGLEADQYTEFGDSFLDNRQPLPPGIRVERVYLGDQPTALDSIVFLPDGVSDPYVVSLIDGRGRRKEVRIGVWYDEAPELDEVRADSKPGAEPVDGATE